MNDWPSGADFSPSQCAAIYCRAREIGREIFARLPESRPNVFQRRWWDDRLMAWSMQDELLKVELFRFVDVLPMLGDSESVVRHLEEYLAEAKHRLPPTLQTALGVARRVPFTRAAVARAAKLAAMDFARRFIAGDSAEQAVRAAAVQRKQGRAFTLDILGEAVISEEEAEAFFLAYCDLIEKISPEVASWDDEPRIDATLFGPSPRMNLSIKLSALDSQFDPIDPQGSLSRAGGRLRELLRLAKRHGAFLNVDMESYAKKDLTLAIFRSVLEEPEFRSTTDVGIVIQCYLRDSATDLVSLRDWAARRGSPVWVRLVKGAYWDYETVHARANGWPIPVYQRKPESDAQFEANARFLAGNCRHLRPAIGTHNIRSAAYALAAAESLELPPGAVELQMLHGMADAEKSAFVERGERLRVYMPFGELIPGMAYLVRRLLENTSNDSFLRAGFMEHVSPETLLRDPRELLETSAAASEAIRIKETNMGSAPGPTVPNAASRCETPFQNEPPIDFAVESNRRKMSEALAAVREELGSFYPLLIDGEQVETDERLDSVDPSQNDRVVGRVSLAGREHVDRAVAAAAEAAPAWSALGAAARAEFLFRAADAMRRRFFELCAWEIYECGKGWREAAGDVCEAIDFCEYYARGAFALDRGGGLLVPGEENRFRYIPRGTTAVIAPWNFPLAILTGMTAAALATGNPVVMKPAEQSSVVAALLMEIFSEAELPPGVLHYLPGRGEVAGASLVEHPQVAVIAFTGSRNVGLAINAKAAETSARGIGYVKRVIAEMGGKNAIIVDADADLDEAVLGVVKSAFGYQGQKCSACSRAIVLESVYEAFLKRLVAAAKSLKIGPAEDPATSVGPLIDAAAVAKVREYIALGKKEGKEILAADAGPIAKQGNFIGPHIFADVAPDSRIAREEIFGPVLAVIRAADLDHALEIANSTEYALTGGFFSRSPANLGRAEQEFQVGNLYLNRGITGAMVGRQPFGGYKMSGIGSKAGGADYLLQFVIPRTITENTLRRGFAPPET